MGFSQPKTVQEPTLRRCKFCGRPIHYVTGTHTHAAPGWCHIAPGAWAICSGKSAAIPATSTPRRNNVA